MDETMRAQYGNPAIKKAFGVLEALSADEQNRYLAEIREKALRNERSELAAAKREGIEEGTEKGVRKTVETLLKMGVLSIEQIAEATGLGIGEIRKLRNTGE